MSRGARRVALLSLALMMTLAVALAGPAIAFGAFAFRTPGSSVLSFAADPGEQNDTTITLDAGLYTIADDGAGVTQVRTTAPCTSVDPQTVTCPAAGIDEVSVALESMDDRFSLTAPTAAFIRGGDGADSLTGGAGDDQMLGERGGDTINGGAGNDELNSDGLGIFAEDSNTLDGGPGNDDLLGGAGPDSIQGGADADELQGLSGNDSQDGGDGADLVTGGDGNDSLTGGAGDDRVGSPQESVFGIPPEQGDDRLDGGPGDDTVRPGAGPTDGISDADVLTGGDGRDTVTYEQRAVAVAVSLDAGANDGSLGEGDNVGNDVERLVGGASDDRLAGGGAPDEIDGGGGADLIDGGAGADTLDGGTTDAESDTLDGGEGADLLRGNAGDDALIGGAGADTLEGGGDDDALEGGADPDVLSGGPGVDDLSGGSGPDVLNGSAPGPVGFDGGDTLRGDEGDDVLEGGEGDDTLVGGAGADDMSGGPGAEDTADYGISNQPLTVTLDNEANDGLAGERDNVRSDVENIDGGGVNDTFTGSGRDNRLDGGAGEDYVDGRRGIDNLRGSAEIDVVRARDGGARDVVSCGRGRDFAIVEPEDRVDADCEAFDDGSQTVPTIARDVVVRPLRGETEFGPPGMERTVPLEEQLKLPVQSQVDATDGRVRLTSARGGRGRRQSGLFSGGRFQVVQRRSRRPLTELRLRGGNFEPCRARAAGSARAQVRASAKPRRKLTIKGRNGKYRVRGRNSAGNIRGTEFTVEDRCDGTLTRVSEGVVRVRDFTLRRTVIVRAGERYLARAP